METITVESRNSDVKGMSTQEFEEMGKIPGVLYGKSLDSSSVFVKAGAGDTIGWHVGSKFKIKLGKESYLATLDEVQRNIITRKIRHLSFHVADKSEVIQVEVPIHSKGEPEGAKSGGNLTQMLNTVSIKGQMSKVPEVLEFDISSLAINENLTLSDFKLPKGVEFILSEGISADEMVVFTCSPSKLATTEEESPEVETVVSTEAE